MKNMTPRRMAEVAGGVLHIPEGMEETADREVSNIVTDSRKTGEGSCFAAIPGSRVDGHTFIPQVFAQGAACVLSERELTNAPGCWIRVGSTLQALQALAEYYRKVMNIPVVGVTGSVGKTSTKEMIASVLSRKYRVLKTEGNFNNELGLPLTIFNLREEHEIAVLEMGISHFGEMHRLSKIARPDTAVITVIGNCHLEFLGSRDGVLKAKTEIFDFLNPGGHIVLNGDDDKLAGIKSVGNITPVRYGLKEDREAPGADKPKLDYWAENTEEKGLDGVSCRIHMPDAAMDVLIPMPGRHNVMNALAAAAVGEIYGLTPEEIREGIEQIEGIKGRFHIVRTGKYTVIDDCYNANPASMEESLHVLSRAEGRKVAVLGDMGELGADEKKFHAQIGTIAGQCGIDVLACAGKLCLEMAQAARQAAGENGRLKIYYYEDRGELMAALPDLLREKDTILIKASHFMEYDRIVEALTT